MEEWRRPGEPYTHVTYLVSNLGRVMDGRTGEIKEGILSSDGLGYKRVYIPESFLGTKREFVHRLVASAFCDGYRHSLVVNHIDCDPTNNRADNLEWVTQQENLQHRDYKATLFQKYTAVYLYNDDGLVAVYASQELVAKDGHYPSRVSEVRRGVQRVHHKLMWGTVGDSSWNQTYSSQYYDDEDYFLVAT